MLILIIIITLFFSILFRFFILQIHLDYHILLLFLSNFHNLLNCLDFCSYYSQLSLSSNFLTSPRFNWYVFFIFLLDFFIWNLNLHFFFRFFFFWLFFFLLFHLHIIILFKYLIDNLFIDFIPRNLFFFWVLFLRIINRIKLIEWLHLRFIICWHLNREWPLQNKAKTNL